MKQLMDFINESQIYTSAGTSIQGKEVAALKKIFTSGAFTEGGNAIDYGAGKYGRNAKYLRAKGVNTYAYDPYNGSSVDGYVGVSTTLPSGVKFDTGFSSYVLNVVPEEVELKIIKELESVTHGKVFHICRGSDITDTVWYNLSGKSKNKYMFDYIEKHYPEIFAKIGTDDISKNDAKIVATGGVQTGDDKFQRIPDLSKYGYSRSGSGGSTVWTK